MTTRRLVFAGDSLTNGIIGGFYGWAHQVRDRLSNLPGFGPLVSSGFVPAYHSYQSWTYSGGWSTPATTDAFFKGWYARTNASDPTFYYASGATKTTSLTLGDKYRYPTYGVRLYFVDYTSGGNWSYKINSGSFTDIGTTLANNNTIKSVDIVNAFVEGDTITVQCSNAAGSIAKGCALIGHEVFYLAPGTTGCIVDIVGISGGILNNACATTSGDPLAMLDTLAPTVGTVIEVVNDIASVNNTTTYNTDLNTFYNRAHTYGPVAVINPYEWSVSATTQANYRAQAKTTAAAWSTPGSVKDIYDDLSAAGIAGYTATNAAGLVYDGTHQSQAGHNYFAERIYWWARNNFAA